jgi:SAM-dependent methyltransferase
MIESARDALRQAYDGNVAERQAKRLPPWRKKVRATFLAYLRDEHLKSLLEIGSGVGRDAQFFAAHGCRVTCIDLSPKMVACCQQKGLHACVMDVAALSFADQSFDAVYSVNCLLHLTDTELPAALQEIRRVLRPGGLFYYGTWGGVDQEGVYEEDHLTPPRLFCFRADGHLRDIVARFFEVVAFQSLSSDETEDRFRFQSILLRKTADPSTLMDQKEGKP